MRSKLSNMHGRIAYALTFAVALTFTACEEKSSSEAKTAEVALEESTKAEEATAENSSNGDTLVYHWGDDLCYYIGYYLSSQYSKENVDTIYKLQGLAGGVLLDVEVPSVFEPIDTAKIAIQKLTNEYQNLIKFLDNSDKSISIPFWKNYIAERKSFAQKFYYLKKMELEALADPTVLLSNKYPNSDCDKYALALAYGDTTRILEEWKRLVEEDCKKYNYEEMGMARFHREYNSSEKYLYAKKHLFRTGWWNCVNPYNEIDFGYWNKVYDEFKKIFVKINSECDEP